jgi:acetoin utilization protein AcuB
MSYLPDGACAALVPAVQRRLRAVFRRVSRSSCALAFFPRNICAASAGIAREVAIRCRELGVAHSVLNPCVPTCSVGVTMNQRTRVADFMTADPHSIELRHNLATAEQRMKALRVRQLPVLHAGSLRGTISDRDVALVRALELDPRDVGIDEVLAFEPYTVPPDAPLGRVARAMAAHRYGCAMVVDRGRLSGIFTATDALRALAELVERYEPGEEQLAPGEVRDLILSEHVHIRSLLARALEAVQPVAGGQAGDGEARAMRDAAHSVYTALIAHTELEDRVLGPVLETIDAWGPARASHLRREHALQRMALDRALVALEEPAPCVAALAASIEDILHDIQRDMEHEEVELLKSDLLEEEMVAANTSGG